MSAEQDRRFDERTQQALEELQGLIRAGYPDANFQVVNGDDPPGVYLKATIDTEDVEEAVEVFGERMLEMQVDEGLPIYVIPLQPLERVMESMRVPKPPRKHSVLDLPPPLAP